jgi:hypothetical protein
MIPEAEIRRLAAVARVDPMVLDLDYSLGWFLAAWYLSLMFPIDWFSKAVHA